MRILHVVPSYVPAWRYGGPIHSVHGLARAMAARGHAIAVATTSVDGDADSDVPIGRPVDVDGVEVHYFPCTRLRRLYYSPALARFVAGRLPACDLLHTHSVFLWPTSAAAQLARRASRPYILSPRGMLVRELIARRNPWVKRAWIAALERRNVECAQAVHVTSRVEAEELAGAGFRPRRVFEVPNGVDLPDAAPCPAPAGLPQRYALFLGRIHWKKGLDVLVEALQRAPGLTLVVAGNDEESYWPQIERAAASAGVADRIRRTGYVEGAAKRALLAHARVLVLPSRSENFGNVVLEAMAHGTPVVVTPEVGLAPVVARARAGIVASGAEAIGAALARLASDARLREEMAANGLAVVREYAWDAVAGSFEAEYERVLAQPAARALAR